MAYQEREIWCAIYCRLSEEDRDKADESDESRSIQNQKSMLVSYAEANAWKIYKVYSDDDFTGADRNRPAFNELMEDAEARRFQIVLCKSQARFTREMELVERILHYQFPMWGIRFIGLADNADTANKGNKKSRQINGLVNEWYLEDLSDNIKSVLTDKRKKGLHIGAFCVYGYQKDPDYKGHLLPDPEAAKVVHLIFELFASGMGKSAIARRLNMMGIPNPTEYKRQKGIRKNTPGTVRSTLWQYYAISDILNNEMYIGNMVQGKYGSVSYKTHQNKPRPREEWIRVENTHAPIIERELWDIAQGIIQRRTKVGWDGRAGKFARKVKCMYCGYTMASKKAHGLYYLTCSSQKIKPGVCRGGFISQKELEDAIMVKLKAIMSEYLDMDAAERQIVVQDEDKNLLVLLRKDIVQYKDRQQEIDAAVKTLYLDRVKGILSPQDFVGLSAAFKAEVGDLEEKILNAERQIEALKASERQVLSKRRILEQYVDFTELSYEMVNTLINYVEVGKREGDYRRGNKVPIVIHWNF